MKPQFHSVVWLVARGSQGPNAAGAARWIGILVACAALASVLVACGGDDEGTAAATSSEESQTLKVAVDPTYRPLAFKDGGELTGFDVDLAGEMADHMGRDLQFVELGFDGIIPAMNAGNVDTNVDLAVTDERKEQVSFTTPYLEQTNVAVVPASEPDFNPDVEQLKGLNVGVTAGTAAEQLVRQTPDIEVTPYNSTPDSLQDLLLGRIDAVVLDSLTAGYTTANTYPDELRVSTRPASPQTIGVAAAVKKGNDELLDEMNRALAEMRKDGSLNTITTDWFGTEVGKVVGG